MKKKIFLGLFWGLIFCLFDGMMSHSDTAPLDNEFGIEIISWPFFISKMIIYTLIGGLLGFIIPMIVTKIRKR
ncbi:hypothetical protein BWK59_10160 [Flavobacterium davisii]|uniref:Uncharacterized protein n=1 Tax=Flavobacterium davisii TaxID=2906077 RepID=A0A246GIW2_9FLAO|nr:hypothetical protein [Flavobacterium davisii]OWP83509.1 hypothetical protein BWK59_10160 [Flavobacterium davisii]